MTNVCSSTQGGHFPAPDQPIIGYNQTWVAAELACFGPGGVGEGSDQLILVSSSLTWTPVQKTPPFNGARPSRDVSKIGTDNLFLVASEVPSGSSLPYVQVTTVSASGNFIGPGSGGATVNSPGNGVPGNYGLIALAQHDSCGVNAGCRVNLEDARITKVILQAGNDGHQYLLTSFHAGDQTNTTAQALYYMGQADSFATTNQWNGWYFYGSSYWAGYPTITMDSDLDTAFTFQTFALNSNIYPNWYLGKGFIANNNSFAQNPPLLGYGILANSYRGAYNGCPSQTTPQRWGDYMSTIWDPNLWAPLLSPPTTPDESGGFWTVQEYSTGGGTQTGSNESTQITRLADPLPYFVGYSVPVGKDGTTGENECDSGGHCGLVYSVPTGAQFGDLLIAVVGVGGIAYHGQLTLPTGWQLLPLQNHSDNYGLQSTDTAGNANTTFVAAYIYGSQPNDTGIYTFGVDVTTVGPETFGYLVTYRGASSTIPGNYLLYGRGATADTQSVITPALSPANKDSPPGETTLLNIFFQDCFLGDDPDGFVAFGKPSGSPALTVETPLNPGGFWLAADVPVLTGGGTYGAYTSALKCTTISSGYSLVIPE